MHLADNTSLLPEYEMAKLKLFIWFEGNSDVSVLWCVSKFLSVDKQMFPYLIIAVPRRCL